MPSTSNAPYADLADDEEDALAPEEAPGDASRKRALLVLLARFNDRAAEAIPADSGAAAAFGDRMEALLMAAHTQAARLGRVRAGVEGPLSDDDRAFADAAVEAQAPYLAGFVKDIEAGRYAAAEGGGLSAAAIAARAALYAGAVYATANRAFVAASPEGARYTWSLNSQNPCVDCPEIAAGGPYTEAELEEIGYPGEGRQSCGGNCRCSLEVVGEPAAFERESEN